MSGEPDKNQLGAKRETLLEQLSPKEAAMFRFLEHLSELENTSRNWDDPKVMVNWGEGKTTDEIIQSVLEYGKDMLPLPYDQDEKSFGWWVGFSYNDYEKPEMKALNLNIEKLTERYPTKGSNDIIIVGKDDCLSLHVRTGTFDGMEKEVEAAFSGESFPIEVIDYGSTITNREGFDFSNSAYKALSQSQ